MNTECFNAARTLAAPDSHEPTFPAMTGPSPSTRLTGPRATAPATNADALRRQLMLAIVSSHPGEDLAVNTADLGRIPDGRPRVSQATDDQIRLVAGHLRSIHDSASCRSLSSGPIGLDRL